MKKTLFIILALCSMSYGLSGYSMYKTYVAKDTVTHINLDSNFYRGVNWSNKLADTIDRNFIRWYDFNSHDSTLRYFKVDTIRSNPNIDSIAGDVKFSGAPTIAGTLTTQAISGTTGTFSGTVSVDTLKSTKGINATGGAFSGRITGSDVEVSDSIKGVTGSFSGALTSTTLNTGNGANELYAMNQNVRTSDAVTFTTLNTGNGANELYPMNQAVTTTSDVVFDSTRTRVSVFDSVKLGAGSYLKTYLDTTFTVYVYEDNTLMTTAQVKVVQIGKMIMMYVPTITITKVGVGSDFRLASIPSKFLPSVSMYCHVIAISNSTYMTGYAEAGNPFLLGATNDANGLVKLAPGTSGVAQSIITWIIN